MGAVAFPAEVVKGFRARCEHEGTSFRCSYSGTLDAVDAVMLLEPELESLHQQLLNAGVKTVTIDFCDVTHMSSDATKTFLLWFMRPDSMTEVPYSIEVIYDPSSIWQRLSFSTMQKIASNAVKIRAK
jgi:hypothetical protein